jgi:hypothetical protein
VKRWEISAVFGLCAVLASALAPRAARAESRFETTPTARLETSTASLDFSIVVPDVVYLGPARSDDGKDAARPFAPQKPRNVKVREPYTAITNSGTIAFSAAEEGQMQPAEPGGANVRREPPSNRVYVVAIP